MGISKFIMQAEHFEYKQSMRHLVTADPERCGKLADLKLKSGLFKHISGPRLGARLVMNKNGLIIPMCSSMTLRKGFKIYNFRKFEFPAINYLDCIMTLEVFEKNS